MECGATHTLTSDPGSSCPACVCVYVLYRYDTDMEEEAERACWEVRLAETTPAKLELWRVIGDEADIAAYAMAHAAPPATTAAAGVVGDWSAMYFQLSPENAAGTLGYRWDKGYAVARLVRVSLPLAACGAVALVVDDTGRGTEVEGGEETGGARGKRRGVMAASDVPGAFKAALLKSRLGIPQGESLLPALGRRTPKPAVLVCRESAGEWEVAVPHQLLPVMIRNVAWVEQRVAEFKPRAGVTAEVRPWSAEESGRWLRWHDGDSVSTAGVRTQTGAQEPPPAWLSNALEGIVAEATTASPIPSEVDSKPAPPPNRPV